MAGFGPEGEPPRDARSPSQGNRPEPIEPQQGRPADASLAPDLQEQRGWIERSHEELVAAFRQLIRMKRQEGSHPDWPELGGRANNYSSARIIRHELLRQTMNSWSRGSPEVESMRRYYARPEVGEEGNRLWSHIEKKMQLKEFYHPIQLAWDVIAFDHYVDRTGRTEVEEQIHARTKLASYNQETGQTAITLSKLQRHILGALAEAADIPHQKAQTDIPIPERRREYEE